MLKADSSKTPEPIQIKPVDRKFYESRLRGFLPDRIIDVHAHIWTAEHAAAGGQARLPETAGGQARDGRPASWPARVVAVCPVEDLLESYRLMLPGKAVMPMVFGNPLLTAGVEAMNQYVAQAAARCRLPALMLARPEWSGQELEDRVLAGGFLGVKVYLTYAPSRIPAGQVRIFDFLPEHQLSVLDRRGWIVMLHIPRPKRLRDGANIEDLLRIEGKFAGVRMIVAHVGRAYCVEDVGDAFDALAKTERMCFDISANTNEEVFARLIAAVGPRRILFGSDMPITKMRMRRVCENGSYVNIVPRGLYGDVSGDVHMREADAPEAGRLTLFLYEEIDAFRRAAQGQGLTRADVEDVFHGNARRMLDGAGA